MKYQSGETISPGDRVTYNGQDGCIALIGGELESGSHFIKPEEWSISESELLILFDNGARLILDDISEEDLLVFRRRKREGRLP